MSTVIFCIVVTALSVAVGVPELGWVGSLERCALIAVGALPFVALMYRFAPVRFGGRPRNERGDRGKH